MYIVTLNAFIYENVTKYENVTRRLKFRYISILTNLIYIYIYIYKYIYKYIYIYIYIKQ